MSTTATRTRHLGLVRVPTPDQDRAIEFYESIGFENGPTPIQRRLPQR